MRAWRRLKENEPASIYNKLSSVYMHCATLAVVPPFYRAEYSRQWIECFSVVCMLSEWGNQYITLDIAGEKAEDARFIFWDDVTRSSHDQMLRSTPDDIPVSGYGPSSRARHWDTVVCESQKWWTGLKFCFRAVQSRSVSSAFLTNGHASAELKVPSNRSLSLV